MPTCRTCPVRPRPDLILGLEHGQDTFKFFPPCRPAVPRCWRLARSIRRRALLPDRWHQRADRAAVPAPAQRAVRGWLVVDHAGTAADPRLEAIERLAREASVLAS